MKHIRILIAILAIWYLGSRWQQSAQGQAVNHYVNATFHPSATTAGLAVECTTLPSSPSNGAVACDSGDSNQVKVRSNGAWVTVGGAATTQTLYLNVCAIQNAGASTGSWWFAPSGVTTETLDMASGVCGYQFLNSADKSAYLVFPNGYSSVSSITVYVANSGSASTGIAYMRNAVGCIAVDGSTAGTSLSFNADTITSYDVSQITAFRGIGNYTVSSLNSTGCTSAKRMSIRFQRLGVTDAANDTTSVDLDLIGVKIVLNL